MRADPLSLDFFVLAMRLTIHTLSSPLHIAPAVIIIESSHKHSAGQCQQTEAFDGEYPLFPGLSPDFLRFPQFNDGRFG